MRGIAGARRYLTPSLGLTANSRRAAHFYASRAPPYRGASNGSGTGAFAAEAVALILWLARGANGSRGNSTNSGCGAVEGGGDSEDGGPCDAVLCADERDGVVALLQYDTARALVDKSGASALAVAWELQPLDAMEQPIPAEMCLGGSGSGSGSAQGRPFFDLFELEPL